MTTLFVKEGTSYTPIDNANLDTHPTLPTGTYIIREKPMGGPLYFDKVDDFTLPAKLYGDTEVRARRILSTFMARKNGTGVLLSGEKGSGKTLLAKCLAIYSGMPVILINAPLYGDKFNSLIQSLEQPAMVLFDEFEKVYDKDQQAQMLTLLDGVFDSKKLFVLTCNDVYRVNDHMRNRPGRLFYALTFKGLSLEFIADYCQDRLNNKAHIDAVCSLSMLFREFNFDMLAALVEEMNRYDEDPHKAIEMLNIVAETWSSYGQYQITLTKNGESFVVLTPSKGIMDKSPVFDAYFEVRSNTKIKRMPKNFTVDEDGDETYDSQDTRRNQKYDIRVIFYKKHLKHVDKETESYTFINDEGYTAVVTRKPVVVRPSLF